VPTIASTIIIARNVVKPSMNGHTPYSAAGEEGALARREQDRLTGQVAGQRGGREQALGTSRRRGGGRRRHELAGHREHPSSGG
jgi:hypothetical protein